MHSYSRLSNLTPTQVGAVFQALDQRIIDARKHQIAVQQGSALNAPSDFKALPLPSIPPVPVEVGFVLHLPIYSTGSYRSLTYDCRHRSELCSVLAAPDPKATAAQLVTAIKAAREYVETYEAITREYEKATREAIEAHLSAQIDAVKELVGLCS